MISENEHDTKSWDTNGPNSLELWDYTMELECLKGNDDLQLAAELGKTLLERNKELETALKSHQNVIEDQTQEIEYLSKQTVALREVNDSRLRIYEQLEISIQDLERTNHRLALDHSSDKKQIKILTGTVESLESRCEELQKLKDELTRLLEVYKHRAERESEEKKETQNKTDALKIEVKKDAQPVLKSIKDNETSQTKENLTERELIRVSDMLEECRLSQMKEQRKVEELEEQLSYVIQSNNRLQEKLRDKTQNDDVMKTMKEELSILEEMREQQLCSRCLRTVDGVTDSMSAVTDDSQDTWGSLRDDPTWYGQIPPKQSSSQIKEKSYIQNWNANSSDGGNNLYRDLVEKYEALLEVQRYQVDNIRKAKPVSNAASHNTSAPLSLQEELQMSGNFTQLNIKDTDEESAHGNDVEKSPQVQTKLSKNNSRKNFIRTPDFSEAETSSSGFSDEMSNKATQTDRERPGSFLCTIADGEDCRFSIYDDGSPIDSRFRNKPEYRELFKEIFTILKKAADNKDDGEKLPLLDDTTPSHVKVPPVTPAAEEAPGDLTDETQSIISSVMSERSVAFSDMSPPEHAKGKENVPNSLNEVKKQLEEAIQKPSTNKVESEEPQRVLTPLVKQPLEYMSATAQFKKRSSRHKNRKQSQDRQGAESPVIPSPPKIMYQSRSSGSGSRRRRDFRPLDASPLVKSSQPANMEYNGASLNFFNSAIASPVTSQNGSKTYQRWNPDTEKWDIRQSMASQELNKLRKLELSYAEVLRNADKNKGRRRRHQ